MSKRQIIYRFLSRLTFYLILTAFIVGCSPDVEIRILSCEDRERREDDEFKWNKALTEHIEKQKMKKLFPNLAPQPSGPEEAAHYEDEPEQTAVSTEKKHLNIAGRWVGTYTITDHTGPDYGGVTYEYGTNEELVFSVNQAANSDQATVTAYGTECATTFNSESRKLEFTYKSNFQGSLIVAVFRGTVSSDLSTIEGTFVQTWPDGTKFSGTWRVRR
jgi:hypothetical protein